MADFYRVTVSIVVTNQGYRTKSALLLKFIAIVIAATKLSQIIVFFSSSNDRQRGFLMYSSTNDICTRYVLARFHFFFFCRIHFSMLDRFFFDSPRSFGISEATVLFLFFSLYRIDLLRVLTNFLTTISI